jgi:hypothetical protein
MTNADPALTAAVDQTRALLRDYTELTRAHIAVCGQPLPCPGELVWQMLLRMSPHDAVGLLGFALIELATTVDADCPRCRKHGVPARVADCGPACHEAHTYVTPCARATTPTTESEK